MGFNNSVNNLFREKKADTSVPRIVTLSAPSINNVGKIFLVISNSSDSGGTQISSQGNLTNIKLISNTVSRATIQSTKATFFHHFINPHLGKI